MNIAIIVKLTKQNRYSFASLLGAVELDKRLEDVHIIISRNDLLTHLAAALKGFDQLIVCYSFMSSEALSISYEVSKLRSLYSKNVLFVAGGPHPTGDPKGTLKMGFDVVVLGEGEKTFPELVYRIAKGIPFENIDGIAIAEGDRIKLNYARSYIDLDSFTPFSIRHKLFAPIEISRGCPWACKFCQTPRIFGFKMRHRSVECIVRLAKIAVKYGYKNMWFISPNAFAYGSSTGKEVNASKIEELLSSLREIKGIEKIFFGTFPSEVRPEFVTPEILELITEYTTNKTLVIGAQSGSQRILDLTNRGHTVSDIYKAVDFTLEFKLIPHLDFIFGLPGEKPEDLECTKQMIMELVKKGSRIHAHVFMPLPGTPYEEENPGILDKETRKWLTALAKNGKLNGYWSQHIKIGKDLLKLRIFKNHLE